jgi:hypothetical protein
MKKSRSFDLSKYQKKPTEKADMVTSSVYLSRDQITFLKLKQINLSNLVRDIIDDIMAKEGVK